MLEGTPESLGSCIDVERVDFSFNSLSVLLIVSGRKSPFDLTCQASLIRFYFKLLETGTQGLELWELW